MPNRAERRHHKFRKREYAERVYKDVYKHTPENAKEFAKKAGDHLKSCSCDMCCNPRHSGFYRGREKLTVPEKKALDDFNSMMDDIIDDSLGLEDDFF